MTWADLFQSGPLVVITVFVLGLLIKLLSTVYHLMARLEGLETTVSNHIPTQINEIKAHVNKSEADIKAQINKLEIDIKTQINRLEIDLRERIKKVEEQGHIERIRIEDKLDHLIEHLINK